MKQSQLRTWAILGVDLCIYLFANLLMSFFTSEFLPRHLPDPSAYYINVAALGLYLLLFQVIFRTYDSLWRYAECREYFTLFLGLACGSLTFIIFIELLPFQFLPINYLVAVVALTAILMLAVRIGYRLYLLYLPSHRLSQSAKTPVAILGAGNAGLMILKELTMNPSCKLNPTCFFDDQLDKQHKRISGVPVVGKIDGNLPRLLEEMSIREIIVAIPSASQERQQEILSLCAKVPGAHIRTLPDTLAAMEHHDQPISTKLRPVEIEDLLGRKPAPLASAAITHFLSNKTVLITGGGGSIGSELCRQIAAAQPKQLVIVDIYENNAYDIQQELHRIYGDNLDLVVEIASIRDQVRIEEIFSQYRPQVVFHAAAHKHVPLMETSPQEAVRNNVFGTLNVVTAAHNASVEKFVQISTDKAVNPTNIMGATKRMCEMILQSMQGRSNTEYVAVRFGNVLGSNGSVVPLFKQQIARGGPITITDKRIIRYFMTIPEAAQLVLQAGAMATTNNVFVLDMGKPVKILDLAENLIRLSGYTPYDDIDIVETGLRPGEKLFEELLIGGDVKKTDNDLIFIEHQPPISQEELEHKLSLLRDALDSRDNSRVREALHCAVPTFIEADALATK